ncbi:MAG: gatA 7 [Glaciihabitans sp.]|nr:gatA 7 [Glaciihabitans sp.]
MTDSTLSLHELTAVALAAGIREREFSAVEVMSAHLARIEETNGRVNAIVAMIPESAALAEAEAADRAVARGDATGALHGLPAGIKDLMDVVGLPTTHGSAAYANAASATRDALIVGKMRAAGAIIIGKTNTPEVGLGTLTFNPVHGITRNPYDLSRHAGGSSGGSAAAVASGMLPIADGSDSGGSLRYPAAFCNIVGLRPTPGRVASGRSNGWTAHGVLGPMARNSLDAALLLSAMAGPDPIAPMSIAEDPALFRTVTPSNPGEVRIAWSADAGGVPIDPDIQAAHLRARAELVALGYQVHNVELELADAEPAWETIEMFNFFASGRADAETRPELLRADYLRNIRQGEALTAGQLADAFDKRTEVFRRTAGVLHDYDLIIAPATPVSAPPAEVEWVHSVDGVEYDRYFRWQMLANRFTVTAHPVAVTPGGFTDQGRPVGLQVVGRHRGEFDLLRHTAGIEALLGYTNVRPAL